MGTTAFRTDRLAFEYMQHPIEYLEGGRTTSVNRLQTYEDLQLDIQHHFVSRYDPSLVLQCIRHLSLICDRKDGIKSENRKGRIQRNCLDRVRSDDGAEEDQDSTHYIAKVRSKTATSIALGARSRYRDLLVTHIQQSLTTHGTGNFLTWHHYFLPRVREQIYECRGGKVK